MISNKCSFREFLSAVKGASGFETISMTHEEATSADRLCYKGHRAKTGEDTCCGEYSRQLRGFILYLRHGVKVKAIKDVDLTDFKRIC